MPLPAEWVTVTWLESGSGMVVWCDRCRTGEMLYTTVLRRSPGEAERAVVRHEGCREKMVGWMNPWLRLVSRKK